MAAKPRTRAARHKVVLEFGVLDDATKKRLAACIRRGGKLTVNLRHKATAKGAAAGPAYLQVD
jgi:hypothetical protein